MKVRKREDENLSYISYFTIPSNRVGRALPLIHRLKGTFTPASVYPNGPNEPK